MLFGLIKRKDPICGMKEVKGTGSEKYGKWFCNTNCIKEYEEQMKKEKTCSSKKYKDCCE